MDKYQEMRAFVSVVDSGSFVRAADALGMSKPTVSRYIGDLEARLGVRLLHRTTRKLSLTAEGEVFHARCKDALASVDEAEAEITSHRGDVAGQLKLSVPVTFGELHLAPLWGRFMARHPKVTLDVSLTDRTVGLVDEGYDAAVRIARLADSSLVSRKLSSTRLVLCASPNYLRRHGTPRHPDELASHAILNYSLLATGDHWEFDGPKGRVVVKVTSRFLSNSGSTCRAAAVQHLGIILQPSFLVAGDLKSGALVEVMPQYRSSEIGVYVVYPTRKHVPPKVRMLVDFLVSAFRDKPWAD